MSTYKILGQSKVCGSLKVDTAKNSLLPILAGSILCDEQVTINKVTYYEDINKMVQILKFLGVSIKQTNKTIVINPSSITKNEVPSYLAGTLRASIFLLGPLLSKFKKATVYLPGGCNIGSRPIDLHLSSLKSLGAKVYEGNGFVCVDGSNMKSGNVHLSFSSVGATENIIMASVFLSGTTKISGVAKEPEIVDLCNFLNKMGAKIYGAGTDNIQITGVRRLNKVTYTPIADRIIAGTYALIPLICGGELEVCGCNTNHILPLISLIKNNTCKYNITNDKIYLRVDNRPNGFGLIQTMPYPQFPTDLQQPLCSAATICNGNTTIIENIFENRFKHTSQLLKMGANIKVNGRVCTIQGVKKLHGAELLAEDLRGGASLVLASLGAEGYSTVSNAEIISRGYYNLDKKLQSIGIKIQKQ